MADYKVIFKADSGGGGKPSTWEPGCPLLIKTIQVARNTQTGATYLQLKLWNLTDRIIGSFTLRADIAYQDGTRETVEVNPLDAAIAPGNDYKPEPVPLARGTITNVSARIVEAACDNTCWHSEQPATATPPQHLSTWLKRLSLSVG